MRTDTGLRQMTERHELAQLLRMFVAAADAPADPTPIAEMLRAANAAVLKTLTTIYRDPEMQDLASRVVRLIHAMATDAPPDAADGDGAPVNLPGLLDALAGAVDPPASRHAMRRQYTAAWLSALLATVPFTRPGAWRRHEVQDLASQLCKSLKVRLTNAEIEISGRSEAG